MRYDGVGTVLDRKLLRFTVVVLYTPVDAGVVVVRLGLGASASTTSIFSPPMPLRIQSPLARSTSYFRRVETASTLLFSHLHHVTTAVCYCDIDTAAVTL